MVMPWGCCAGVWEVDNILQARHEGLDEFEAHTLSITVADIPGVLNHVSAPWPGGCCRTKWAPHIDPRSQSYRQRAFVQPAVERNSLTDAPGSRVAVDCCSCSHAGDSRFCEEGVQCAEPGGGAL